MREGARKGGLEYGADTSLLFCVGVDLGGERGIIFFNFVCGLFLFYLFCILFCLLFISLLCYRLDLSEVIVCG